MTRIVLHISLKACIGLGMLFALVVFLVPLRTPQDTTLEAWGIGICDLPCWAGITPQESDLDASITNAETNLPQLMWRYDAQQRTLRLTYGSAEDGFQQAVITLGEETVERIYISGDMPALPILQTWGAPNCARGLENVLADGWQALIVIWEYDSMVVRSLLVGREGASLDTMRLQDVQIQPDDDCASIQGYAWRGFTPLWWYAR
jgi:hypothetical protein